MKTWNAKKEENYAKWYLIDAQDKILGRLSSKIAHMLMGKHKPQYTPHVDTGDFIVVINAEKIKMTGKKWDDKKYYSHSKYFGSLKEAKAKELKSKNPGFLIKESIEGMLPKTKLGKKMIKKLKIYKGSDYPHKAQKVEPLDIK